MFGEKVKQTNIRPKYGCLSMGNMTKHVADTDLGGGETYSSVPKVDQDKEEKKEKADNKAYMCFLIATRNCLT